MLQNHYVLILRTEEELKKFLVDRFMEADLSEFVPECNDEYMKSGVVGYYPKNGKVVLWNFDDGELKHGSADPR